MSNDSDYAQKGLQTVQDLHSMLEVQLELIFPQEQILIQNYKQIHNNGVMILDVGCGTGGFIKRLANLLPNAKELWGVDLFEQNVKYAQEQNKDDQRIKFFTGNAYDLKDIPSNTFDLVTCRSVLHAVRAPQKILTQLIRVLKKGGVVHILGEDYGMLFISPNETNGEKLFKLCCEFFSKTGSDGRIGRKLCAWLSSDPFSKIMCLQRVNYIRLDSATSSRELLEKMLITWREGYTKIISKHSGVNQEIIKGWFDDVIKACREGSFLWNIPITSAVRKF